MTTRFKTFKEFLKDIRIVEGTGSNAGRVNIICKLKASVVYKNIWRPWNSKQTKRWFLQNMYFVTVLCNGKLPQKISQPEKYWWLGRRVTYRRFTYVVVDCWDCTDRETGELVKNLRLYPFKASFMVNQTHPIDVLETDITIL